MMRVHTGLPSIRTTNPPRALRDTGFRSEGCLQRSDNVGEARVGEDLGIGAYGHWRQNGSDCRQADETMHRHFPSPKPGRTVSLSRAKGG
jgi:hypothetical protein